MPGSPAPPPGPQPELVAGGCQAGLSGLPEPSLATYYGHGTGARPNTMIP